MTISKTKLCKQPNCELFSFRSGWCSNHYYRSLATGETYDIYRECLNCGTDTKTTHWFCEECRTNIPSRERLKIYKAKYFQTNKREIYQRTKDNRPVGEERFAYDIKYNYNLTIEEYNRLVERQKNKCAICGADGSTLSY